MDQNTIKQFHLINEEILGLLNEITNKNNADLQLGAVEIQYLQYLYEVDKAVNMKAITTQLKVSQSRITHLSDSLIEKGFVERYASKEDRRVNYAYLTDKGKEMLLKQNNANVQFFAKKLEKLSDVKIKELFESLTEWKNLLKDMPQEVSK